MQICRICRCREIVLDDVLLLAVYVQYIIFLVESAGLKLGFWLVRPCYWYVHSSLLKWVDIYEVLLITYHYPGLAHIFLICQVR